MYVNVCFYINSCVTQLILVRKFSISLTTLSFFFILNLKLQRITRKIFLFLLKKDERFYKMYQLFLDSYTTIFP